MPHLRQAEWFLEIVFLTYLQTLLFPRFRIGLPHRGSSYIQVLLSKARIHPGDGQFTLLWGEPPQVLRTRGNDKEQEETYNANERTLDLFKEMKKSGLGFNNGDEKDITTTYKDESSIIVLAGVNPTEYDT